MKTFLYMVKIVDNLIYKINDYLLVLLYLYLSEFQCLCRLWHLISDFGDYAHDNVHMHGVNIA